MTIESAAAELNSLEEHYRFNRCEYFKPYAFQKEFFFAKGKDTDELAAQRALISANQIGKTLSEAMECSFHATGRYPDWWEGRRFNKPVSILVASNTNEQTRDNCQAELFGDPISNEFLGTGAVPKDYIGNTVRKPGIQNAYDSVSIRHISGGWSKITFRAYEQGKKKFMGSKHDHIWPDEEPPEEIWSQMLRATFSSGGDIAATFTPEEGVTVIVYNFLQDLKKGQAVIQATWDDAPHMTAEVRERFLEQIPAHERKMRSRGIPVMGSGLIFPIEDDQLSCEPFTIPKHWPRICGMDFGWEHPTAAIWMAIDRETNTHYIYDVYRESHVQIPVVASRIKSNGQWIPCMWPHDGLHHDKSSGRPLADLYRDEGMNMHYDQFSNPPGPGQKEGEGGQGVEVGLMAIHEAMVESRFKVFVNLQQWFEEKRLYHRKDGKVVKLRDDLMSATRYAFQMTRFAETNLPRTKTTAIPKGLTNW